MSDNGRTQVSSVEELAEEIDSLEELEDAELETSAYGDNVLSIA